MQVNPVKAKAKLFGLALFFSLSTTFSLAATNLVIDPSAEEGAPNNWSTANQDLNAATGWVTETPHSGKRCLKIINSQGGNAYWVSPAITFTAPYPKAVTLGGYSKAENVTVPTGGLYSLDFYIEFEDGTYTYYIGTLKFTPGTHGWEQKENIYVSSKPIKKIRAYGLLYYGAKGKAWFDDFYCMPSDATSLIPNAGAEDGTPGNWSTANQDLNATTGWVTETPHSGSRCFKIINTQGGNAYWMSPTITLSAPYPKTVILGGYSKALNVTVPSGGLYSLDYYIEFEDGTYTYYINTLKFTPGTHDWEKKENRYTSTKPIKKVRAYGLIYYGAKGTALFDDFYCIPSGGSNIIPNPGAEEYGAPGNWLTANQDLNATTGWVSENPHSGKRCLKIINSQGGNAYWASPTITLTAPYPTAVTLGGYSKAENVTVPSGGLYCLDYYIEFEDGTYTYYVSGLSFTPGTHGWEQKENMYVSSKPIKKVRAYGLLYYGTRGTAWFDDFYVYDTPNQPPVIGTLTPSSGTGAVNTPVSFVTTFSDPNGWRNIQYVYFLINTSVNGLACPYLYYNQNSNLLYIRNDANTSWGTGYSPGSNNVLENSYAKLDCKNTLVSGSGQIMTVSWSLSFKLAFTSGVKNCYLYVTDDAGSAVSWTKKGTRTIDNTPPTGSISINNNSPYTNQESVTLNLSAADDLSGIDKMQFSNDNITWSNPEAYSATKSWTLLSGDGEKTVYVKFIDKAGNYSQIFSDTIIVDILPPVISDVSLSTPVLSPNNDAVKDTVILTALINMNAEWIVNIKDANNEICRNYTGTGSSINITWDGKNASSTVVPDAVYTYTIDAVDIATGAGADQISGPIGVDTTPPTCYLTAPVSGQNISGKIDIKGVASDINWGWFQGAFSLFYRSSDEPETWYYLVDDYYALVPDAQGNAPVFYTWDTTPLHTGNYVLRFGAIDAIGNKIVFDVTVTVAQSSIYNLSLSTPVISPNNDAVKDTVTLTALVNTNANWTVNIKDSNNVIRRSYSGTGSSINLTWDGKDTSGTIVPDGIYTYTINATDIATGAKANPLSGPIGVDTTPPTCYLTAPVSGQNVSGNIEIRGVANDLNWGWLQGRYSLYYRSSDGPETWHYLVDDYPALVPDAQGNAPLFYTWDTNLLPNGNYILRMGAMDAIGNKITSDTPVIIQNAGPDITDLAVTPGTFTPDGLDDDITNDIANITFKLSGHGFTTVKVYDKDKHLVKTICNDALHPSPAKNMQIELQWNGRDDSGALLRNGQYEIVVSTGGGTKQASAYITINDRPIFNDFTVTPSVFSPNGDGIDDTATFTFSLSEDSIMSVGIYNSQDQLVKTFGQGIPASTGQVYTYTWDGKNNSGQTVLQGRYYFQVTAAALTGSPAAPLKLSVLSSYISGISISSDTFNPYEGQAVSIFYRLITTAKLNIKIYDAQNNLVKNLITGQIRGVGQHTETWDGINDGGNIVRDGCYYFKIEDATGSTAQVVYDPTGTGGQDISHSIGFSATAFDTLKNEPCILSYSLPHAVRINIKIRPERYQGPAIRVITYQEPVGSGEHQDIWDGRDESGNLVPYHNYTIVIWGYRVEENAFIVAGGRPVLSQMAVNPIKFNPIRNPYGPAAQNSTSILFTLSKDSYVTLDIYNSSNILVRRLLDNTLKSGGQISVAWDGKDGAGRTLPNGFYRIEAQAQKDGNYSDILTGHTEVIY